MSNFSVARTCNENHLPLRKYRDHNIIILFMSRDSNTQLSLFYTFRSRISNNFTITLNFLCKHKDWNSLFSVYMCCILSYILNDSLFQSSHFFACDKKALTNFPSSTCFQCYTVCVVLICEVSTHRIYHEK